MKAEELKPLRQRAPEDGASAVAAAAPSCRC